MVLSIAARFGTGSDPGCPRHTGHVGVLWGAPNSVGHPQNIFVAVESSTWHSRPMIVSNSSGMSEKRYRSHAGRSPDVGYSEQMQRTASGSITPAAGRGASPVMV